MNLKARFKAAIFAFFKDEIMGIGAEQRPFKAIESQLKFIELKAEILLKTDFDQRGIEPIEVFYERELKAIKHKLFIETLPHIKVDSASFLHEHPHSRKIQVSLFVGIIT